MKQAKCHVEANQTGGLIYWVVEIVFGEKICNCVLRESGVAVSKYFLQKVN